MDTTGIITTVAGTGEESGSSGDGGPAVEAQLSRPRGVAVDGAGNLYIADASNHRIRKVDTSGTITTIAGTGDFDYAGDGGPALEAWLYLPSDVAVDGSGSVYVADTNNNRIRVLTNPSSTSSPSPPANLTAKAVSSSEINLTWQDTSSNEIGFPDYA